MRRPLLAITALTATAVALALRRAARSWGATVAEAARVFPGDELIEGGVRGAVMATTLPAPPAAVWPWLAQMGVGRAGWYSFDRLDNAGRPSATALNADWQALAAGDRMLTAADGRTWFDVVHVDPPHALVLRDTVNLRTARSVAPGRPLPSWFMDSTWAFVLEDGGDGTTRLIVGGRGRGRPRTLTRIAAIAFWEPAHLVMQLRQFHGLRQRVAGAARDSQGCTPKGASP